MSNPHLSLVLDKIIGKFQAVKLEIGECSRYVDGDSDDLSHFALWQGDIEFLERLIGEYMFDRGLKTEKTPATRHIKRPHKVFLIKPELLDESWVGTERKPA